VNLLFSNSLQLVDIFGVIIFGRRIREEIRMLYFRLDYFGLTGVYFELLGGAKFFWSCAKKKLVSIFFFLCSKFGFVLLLLMEL